MTTPHPASGPHLPASPNDQPFTPTHGPAAPVAPGGPGGPGAPWQPAPRKAGNGLATAGFVLGLLGLLGSFIPVLNVGGMVLGVIGAILAAVGLTRAKRTGSGKGLALSGLVLGVLALVVGIVVNVAFANAVDDAADDVASTSVEAPAQAPADDAAAAPVEEEPAAAGIGTPVRDGKFEFTVTSIEPGVAQVGDQYLNQAAQGQFVLVHVTVTNIGDQAQYFDGSSQKLLDTQGRTHSADTSAAIYLGDANSFLNDINPGNSVEGVVVFDIPADATPASLELHDSMFSGGVTVQLG